MAYKKDPLRPSVEGDSAVTDEQGRVKVLRSLIRGQAFLGSKVNFYDTAEKRDRSGAISEFTNDGAYAYITLHWDDAL